MNCRFHLAIVAFVAASLTVVGCSGGSVGPQVKGQVFLDNKELAGARIVFEGPGGNGTVTNDEGKFELPGTKPFNTVKPGKYTVYITKYVDKKGQPIEPEELEQMIAAGMVKSAIPAKYGSTDMNLLGAEIKEGLNELPPFKLTTK